jgi:hypothetical protein
MNDLAGSVKTVTAIQPQIASGEQSAIYGPWIDRKGYEASVFSVQVGTASGSPSDVGVVFKLQTKSGEVDSADVSGATTTISGETIPHQHEIDQDLKSLDRYIRAVATPHFTGGSSPKIEIAGTCVLGEPKVIPA